MLAGSRIRTLDPLITLHVKIELLLSEGLLKGLAHHAHVFLVLDLINHSQVVHQAAARLHLAQHRCLRSP